MKMPHIPSARDLNKVAVGLVSIGLLGAVVAGAFAVGTLGILENRYAMSGVFEETGGIKAGVEVRLAGVSVGEVTGVHPDFEVGQVVVTWEVDKGTHLGPNTTAEIAIATLLGGHYLRLGGTVEQPYLEDLPEIERRIPLERTKVPYSVIGAIGDTTRTVQQLDIDAINRVVAELADSTERNQDTLPSLFNNLTTVAAAVNAREADFRQLVANSQQVTETLAVRDQQLAQLLDSASVMLGQLAERRDELAAILGDGSRVVTALSDVISTQRASIDSLLADLHVFLGRVDVRLPEINTSLAWAGPTIGGLARVGHGGYLDVVALGLGPTSLVQSTLCSVLDALILPGTETCP